MLAWVNQSHWGLPHAEKDVYTIGQSHYMVLWNPEKFRIHNGYRLEQARVPGDMRSTMISRTAP